MLEPTSEPVTTHWNDHDDPNQETIVLLQDEIARLEAELHARDEFATASQGVTSEPHSNLLDDAQRRADELARELAIRDETVAILLDQARLFEEAAAAQHAEWEQLNQWVEEVERRVDDRGSDDVRLRAELDSERHHVETLRRSADAERRDWDAQRHGLEREAQTLRDLLARQAKNAGAGDDETAFIALASENRKLRTTCSRFEKAATESEEMVRRLNSTLAELEAAQLTLRKLEDDRQREKNEHDTALGALRTQLTRESLERRVDPLATASAPTADMPRNPALEADERIRAFRQHLKELHDHDAEQRAGKSLSARLSRLWHHTSPGN